MPSLAAVLPSLMTLLLPKIKEDSEVSEATFNISWVTTNQNSTANFARVPQVHSLRTWSWRTLRRCPTTIWTQSVRRRMNCSVKYGKNFDDQSNHLRTRYNIQRFVIDCRLANAILEKNNIVFSETKLPADILNLSALYYVNCKSYNPKFKLDVML